MHVKYYVNPSKITVNSLIKYNMLNTAKYINLTVQI